MTEAEGNPPEIQALIDAAYAESVNGDFGPGQKQLIAEVVTRTLRRLGDPATVAALRTAVAFYVAHWYTDGKGRDARIKAASPVGKLLDALEAVLR